MKLNDNALLSLDSGQAFRWQKSDDGIYEGVLNGKFYRLDRHTLDNADPELRDFFNDGLDWSGIEKTFMGRSRYLDEAVRQYSGLRILKQPHFETLISFIISSCNNIVRIKRIIATLCEKFGSCIDGVHFAFPAFGRLCHLDVSDFTQCGMGFRDKYVYDALRKIESGEVDLDAVAGMDTDAAAAELMKIKGVGRKVADCVLLFSYGKFDAFPKDVWIKRALSEKLGINDESELGRYRGVAQQFVFMKIRQDDENNRRKVQ